MYYVPVKLRSHITALQRETHRRARRIEQSNPTNSYHYHTHIHLASLSQLSQNKTRKVNTRHLQLVTSPQNYAILNAHECKNRIPF